MKCLRLVLVLVLAGSFFASSANADIITYSLSDKNLGAEALPDYLLRVDGLFGVESSIWTFSSDSTDVKMVIDTDLATAHIFGDVIGAKDVGAVWDPAAGYSWSLDFLYTDITITDPTTGYWTAPVLPASHINLFNTGSLQLLSDADVDGAIEVPMSDKDEYIALADYHGGAFFLHDPKGPYVSAWLASTSGFVPSLPGLGVDDYTRFGSCCKDFGFRATRVPEPSTLTLLGAGVVGLGFMRRKRAA